MKSFFRKSTPSQELTVAKPPRVVTPAHASSDELLAELSRYGYTTFYQADWTDKWCGYIDLRILARGTGVRVKTTRHHRTPREALVELLELTRAAIAQMREEVSKL